MTELFDFFKPHLGDRYPALKAFAENEVRELRGAINELVDDAGAIPVKISSFRGSKFSDPAFDWLLGAFEHEHHEEALNELFQWVDDNDFLFNPDMGGERRDFDLFVEEHKILARAKFNYVEDDTRREEIVSSYARNMVYDAYADYFRYQGMIALLEKSVVCERLRDLDANYLFEQHHGFPMLIVPDSKVAVMIKLQFA